MTLSWIYVRVRLIYIEIRERNVHELRPWLMAKPIMSDYEVYKIDMVYLLNGKCLPDRHLCWTVVIKMYFNNFNTSLTKLGHSVPIWVLRPNNCKTPGSIALTKNLAILQRSIQEWHIPIPSVDQMTWFGWISRLSALWELDNLIMQCIIFYGEPFSNI